ncbi:PREDICTED: hyaluronidase-2-like [Nanorana parkeri]|uniref:hyaluronidase-2-like n=1 Tax=Nanorana parkeri TaxID=125878 RepID=UPI0008542E8B|nr:PREDICTED: hyaluronidase-2-like [Nanorana parkeri]
MVADDNAAVNCEAVAKCCRSPTGSALAGGIFRSLRFPFRMTPCVGLSCVLWCLLLAGYIRPSSQDLDKPAARPVFSSRPFMVAWNAPTQDCPPRYDVPFDLRLFDLNASPNFGFTKQNLTIFYKERLGLYPYIDERNVTVNGGVPQNASLRAHLDEMQTGINKYIPEKDKDGLAVIDWEEWRPIWIRNWQNKSVYRQVSRQLVISRHSNWTGEDQLKQAQYEFENAAREFMAETLRYAKNYRPRQLWGYYLFPDCYNHDYLTNQQTYTGKCPDVEMSRNDKLWWLWDESTALYPSIYLDPFLKSSPNGRKFVHHRVKEAMRIAYKHHRDYSVPVFVYTRPTYIKKLDLLSQVDLISTIGESAAQGVAGVIFWGGAEYAKNKKTCQTMKTFLDEDLGEYIVNVTTAASLCSQALCGGKGRCLRKDNLTDAFLHLNPGNFRIVRAPSGSNASVPMWAEGQLSSEDIALLHSQFQCQCYLASPGNTCGFQNRMYNGAESAGSSMDHSQSWGLMVLLLMLLEW